DSLIYQTEKTIKDLGDKVPEETKTACDDAAAELKTTLEGDDTDAIKVAVEKLQEASYKLAEILYADAETGAASEDGSEEAADGEEVVDADYEVVDGDE
ncbi:MAG: Hsp70 family protein, partial [Coriobacteriia bacterium]|nr:Hsp70 family protein [Coriobacteriia bacterium]